MMWLLLMVWLFMGRLLLMMGLLVMDNVGYNVLYLVVNNMRLCMVRCYRNFMVVLLMERM